MKKLQTFPLLLIILAAFFAACGRKESGQLVGVLDRPKWKGINPYGMVYVPSGTLHIGTGDEDISRAFVSRPKSISVQGFFMDETEITNNEYRQFVNWVIDSLAHTKLEHFLSEDEGDGDETKPSKPPKAEEKKIKPPSSGGHASWKKNPPPKSIYDVPMGKSRETLDRLRGKIDPVEWKKHQTWLQYCEWLDNQE